MDVEHTLRKRSEKNRGEQTHVTCKAHEINFVLAQASNNRGIVFGAFQTLPWNNMRVQPTLLCSLNARDMWLIRDDNRDLGSGNLSRSYIVGDGNEVRTASGKEDTEFLHAGVLKRLTTEDKEITEG